MLRDYRTLTSTYKFFYRDYFRRVVTLCLLSLFISVLLLLGIYYKLVTKPAARYYASNAAGAGFITLLGPMDAPNYSSRALLPPDPPEEANEKALTINPNRG